MDIKVPKHCYIVMCIKRQQRDNYLYDGAVVNVLIHRIWVAASRKLCALKHVCLKINGGNHRQIYQTSAKKNSLKRMEEARLLAIPSININIVNTTFTANSTGTGK